MKIVNSFMEWCVAHKYEWLGFAVGMVFVLAAAGLYRVSWELPESTPTLQTIPAAPKAATTVQPSPARAPTPAAPAPQRPQRAKPVLKKLDGPPEALRRLHNQQNTTNAP
jgi:hypothetical protein